MQWLFSIVVGFTAQCFYFFAQSMLSLLSVFH